MKQLLKIIMILFLMALCLTIPPTSAQTGSEYDLSWSTLNAGQTSSGGKFSLTGVIGQADASNLSGGEFTLSGGFLFGIKDVNISGSKIYLPFILK